jgi:hypothetical protein
MHQTALFSYATAITTTEIKKLARRRAQQQNEYETSITHQRLKLL